MIELRRTTIRVAFHQLSEVHTAAHRTEVAEARTVAVRVADSF